MMRARRYALMPRRAHTPAMPADVTILRCRLTRHVAAFAVSPPRYARPDAALMLSMVREKAIYMICEMPLLYIAPCYAAAA